MALTFWRNPYAFDFQWMLRRHIYIKATLAAIKTLNIVYDQIIISKLALSAGIGFDAIFRTTTGAWTAYRLPGLICDRSNCYFAWFAVIQRNAK